MPVTTVEITQIFFHSGFFFFKVYLISTAVETNSEYPYCKKLPIYNMLGYHEKKHMYSHNMSFPQKKESGKITYMYLQLNILDSKKSQGLTIDDPAH